MFSTHFVVFDQTSSLDHNNITKLWPLDGSFGQSGGRQYLFSGPKIIEESETTKERCQGAGEEANSPAGGARGDGGVVV